MLSQNHVRSRGGSQADWSAKILADQITVGRELKNLSFLTLPRRFVFTIRLLLIYAMRILLSAKETVSRILFCLSCKV